MKALVWHGGQRLRVEDVAEATPERDEVLVEVELAGICGSDLHAYRGSPGPRVPPLVLGHEVVGRLSGTKVAVYPLVGCGVCEQCLAGNDNLCRLWQLIGMHRQGVFAEKVCVPRHCIVPLPDGLAAERAVLAEPLAACVGALRPELVDRDTRVLVLGCGPIGLLSVVVAARRGAEVMALDPLPERQRLARGLGAARVGSGDGDVEDGTFDVVVDAAGFESTWRTGIDALQNGGSLVVLGLGQTEGAVPMALVVRRAITVRGHFAYSRADFAAAIDLLAAASFDMRWVAEVPLDEGPAAFADLVQRPAEHTKVLLRP